VENVRATNIVMDGVLVPFTVNLYYHCNGAQGDKAVADKNPRPVDEGTPVFRNIHYGQILAVDVKTVAGFFYGLPEMPVENLSLNDISVILASGATPSRPEMADDIPVMVQAGFYFRNIRYLSIGNVKVSGHAGEAFDLDDSVSLLETTFTRR